METNKAYLQQIFTSAAVGIAIFRGPDFVIEMANPAVSVPVRPIPPMNAA